MSGGVGESSPNCSFPQNHAFVLSPPRVSPRIVRARAGEAGLLYLNFFQPACFASCRFGAAFRWVPGCSQGTAACPEPPPWPQITHLRSHNIQNSVPPSEIAAAWQRRQERVQPEDELIPGGGSIPAAHLPKK